MNEPNEKVTSLINAVGSLAETSAMLYHELITKGIPPDHACRMTEAFIKATIGGVDDE